MRALSPQRSMRAHPADPSFLSMILLLLEALAALVLLLFIVWWTMFSGRKKGELPDTARDEKSNGPKDEDAPQGPRQ